MRWLLRASIVGAVVSAVLAVVTFLPDRPHLPSALRWAMVVIAFLVHAPAVLAYRRYTSDPERSGPSPLRGVPFWAIGLGFGGFLAAWLVAIAAVRPEVLAELRSAPALSGEPSDRVFVAVALALYSLGALTIAATLARVRRIRRPAAGGTDSDPA